MISGPLLLCLSVWLSYYAPPLIGGGIKRCISLTPVWRLTSVCLTYVCLSRTSGLSREQRGLEDQNWHRDSPRHTWLEHHSQGEKVKGQGHQAALLSAAITRKAAAAYSPWESTATLRLLGGARVAWAPITGGGEGRGHIVSSCAQLVEITPEPKFAMHLDSFNVNRLLRRL